MTNAEKARFAAQGTFGGGTMTLQITPDGTNWSSSGLTLTANGQCQLTTPCKQARWTLTGATSPSITMAVVDPHAAVRRSHGAARPHWCCDARRERSR
jgi:hypothetical protein